ncbi:MAG TPA: PAS domain S-box protein [Vineibacter sp.]|nr:PAS domain S-box protein [Vineibacter sp.]
MAAERETSTAAEDAVDRSARLQAILDTVPDAVVVIDEHGRIETFSKTAERMFGHAAAQVIGRNVHMLMPSPYHEEHDSYLQHYHRTGEKRIIGIGRVVAGLRRDGTVFPIELSVSEASVDGRQVFIGFIRDITGHQATESRLEELQAELAHVSRQIEMGQMGSTLAHELNQPLTAVLAYLGTAQHLLDAEGGHEKVQAMIERAVTQAKRAGTVIHQLREFLAKGQTTRKPEPINKVVEEASGLALIGAKQLQIDSHLELDPTAPIAAIDRVQIQQVVVNLVRNGIEAMTDGPDRDLVIRTKMGDGVVEVSVSDTGRGIAPEVSTKLFQPFVSTKASGMGIGLSICRSIVRAHGGEIEAHPRPGGIGTVFAFTLPTVGKVT